MSKWKDSQVRISTESYKFNYWYGMQDWNGQRFKSVRSRDYFEKMGQDNAKIYLPTEVPVESDSELNLVSTWRR